MLYAKTKRMASLLCVLLLVLACFGCSAPAGGTEKGQIYLYGELHSVPEINQKEFEIWDYYYHEEGMRHLFVEYPYFMAEYLNQWMQAEDDAILDQIYQDIEGTQGHAQATLDFLHSIKENCPETVFHGTDEETLSRGIGHLYGSSLPVGGAGTHSVLTGHNGFVQATLFDDIDELVEGDVIVVSALGEDLYYEVDQTKTVLPDDAEDLRQVAGKDYLTLVTCTPTGVNTHRLLVRAELIDAPTEDSSVVTIADTTDPAGFPWWALLVVGVPVLTFIVVMPRRKSRNRSGRRATHLSADSDS